MPTVSACFNISWKALREWNLFRASRPPDRNDEQQLRNELISTRIFIFSLLISVLVLLVYTSQVQVTQTITIDSPSLAVYTSLYHDYAQTLTCPCKNIAIAQQEFIALDPTYHQVCNSDFITSNWFSFLNAVGDNNLSKDFRYTGSLLFRILAAFCNISKETIEDSLPRFYSTQFVTNNLVSRDLFYEQCKSSISLYLSTTATALTSSLQFIQDSIFVNGFLSGLATNFELEPSPYYAWIPGYEIFPLSSTYNESGVCYCEYTPTCVASAYIMNTKTRTVFTIAGLHIGCSLIEAMRQSDLQCLYSQICLDQVKYYLQSPFPFNATALDASTPSHYNASTKISELLDNLMVESWSQNITFPVYFGRCQPSQCTYTRVGKNSIIVIINILIGLFGGLYKILFFLVPLSIKIVLYRRNRRYIEKRTGPRSKSKVGVGVCCGVK